MRRAQARRLFHATSRDRDRQQAIDDVQYEVHDKVHRRMLLAIDLIGVAGVITTGAGAAQGMSLSLGLQHITGPRQADPICSNCWSRLELKVELALPRRST